MFDFAAGDDLDLILETARSFATDDLIPTLRDHDAARGSDDRDRSRLHLADLIHSVKVAV